MDTGQKVVVITGASRGIGAELVKGFRGIGYAVVANSRSISSGEAVDDPQILLVEGDIAVPETADRIIGEAILRFGRSIPWSTMQAFSSRSPLPTIRKRISR